MAKGIPTKGTALKLNTSHRKVLFSKRIQLSRDTIIFVSSEKTSFRRFLLAMQKRDGFDPAVNAYLFNILLMCSLTVAQKRKATSMRHLAGRA